MAKIAEKAESSIDYWKKFSAAQFNTSASITNAISHATCTTAMDLNAAAIITVTHSGYTARMISRFRPACPIIATTPSERVQRQLSLLLGVYPYIINKASSTEEIFDMAMKKALETGIIKTGDLVVITAGSPVGISGTTNILKVQTVNF